MSFFLSNLILPLPLLWLILLVGFAGYLMKKKRLVRCCLIGAFTWFALISTGFLPNTLIRLLERTYPPILTIETPESSGPVYIMVLGSGHTDDKSLPPNSQLSPTALGRLIEGVRLYHAIPGSILIFSGDKMKQSESQAIVTGQTAEFLGVSPADIRMFTTTKNTADEAATFRKTFGTSHKMYLVTNANHMPRAMFLFRREGINATAAPTNYLVKEGTDEGFHKSIVPCSDHIFRMEAAVHEWVGMAWARLGTRVWSTK